MFFLSLQQQLRTILRNKRHHLKLQMLLAWLRHHQSLSIPATDHSAIVFAPHQDDETLGCGGLIALKRSQGASVWVIFLTAGDASSSDPSLGFSNLAQTRRNEAISALSVLGVASDMIRFLNYPDGQLQHLSQPLHQTLLEELIQIIDTLKPAEVYIPHADDSHPDHEMTYTLVQSALAQTVHHPEPWQYPVWLFWRQSLELDLKWNAIDQAYRLNIHGVLQKKQQAIKTYGSQYPFFPKQFIQSFYSPYELFFK